MSLSALVAIKPQFLAVGDLEVDHCQDERGNDTTDVYCKKVFVVNGNEYRFHVGRDYGKVSAAEFMALQERLGNQTIATSALVLIDDIGQLTKAACEEMYTQDAQVFF